jgi:two-component system response regulator AtoC
MEFAILILERNERDRALLLSLLKQLSTPIRQVTLDEIESGSTQLDIAIAGMSGTDADERTTVLRDLDRVKSLCPQAQTILCVPQSADELDTLSIDLHARSFLLKPVDRDNFLTLLEHTLTVIRKRKIRALHAQGVGATTRIAEIIGRSERMRTVLGLLDRISKGRDTSVMLQGESGTGKSLFAQAIHEMSDRASGPFMEINCATLPPNLLESELFGYEPGAFTDAKKEKLGLIELADGGTLFLDEISEVDIQTQAKLLKFLDAKKFRRLGGNRDISVDVRVVAASNRDLKAAVASRAFREDLYYRLNVVEITIPPLRERSEDILDISAYYLGEFRRRFNKPNVVFADDALELLCAYHWPGNVRELINIIERAVLLAHDSTIRASDLPLAGTIDPPTAAITAADGAIRVELPPGGVSLDIVEKRVIEEALKQTGGNVVKASRILGLQRGALRYKLMKHKIDARTFARAAKDPVHA